MCSGSVILAAAGLLEGQARDVALDGGAAAARRSASAPVGDERIVHDDDKIVTCAGVSAGIDLGLWLAGRIGGEAKAKAIQLSMEYDPQPPFDSGHMSKASASTKAAATALMTKELAKPAALAATGGLLWDAALRRCGRGASGRPCRPDCAEGCDQRLRLKRRFATLSAISATIRGPVASAG